MKLFNTEIDFENPAPNHFKIWEILGLIPPKEPAMKRYIYIICSLIFHTIITIPFPLFMFLYLFEAANYIEFCGCFYLVIPTIATTAKFFYTVKNIDKLHLVVETADRLNKRALGDEEREIIKKSMKFGQKFTTLIFNMVVFTGSASAFVLYIFPNILPVWFPLDWRSDNMNFAIYFTFMLINCAVYSTIMALSNTYPGVYMCFFIGHMNCFAKRMENLGKDPKKSLEKNEKELSECVQDHQCVLKYM